MIETPAEILAHFTSKEAAECYTETTNDPPNPTNPSPRLRR